MSVLSLAANPVFHSRNKHVELDVHFVRDKVITKDLNVRYVPSSDQLADSLTKAPSEQKFTAMRNKLNVLPAPFRLRGVLEIVLNI